MDIYDLEKKYKKRGNAIKMIHPVDNDVMAVLYHSTEAKEKQRCYNLTLYSKDDNFASIVFFIDKVDNASNTKYANVVEYIAECSLDGHHTEDDSLNLLWETFIALIQSKNLLAVTGEINILDDKLKTWLKDNGFTFFTPNNDNIYYGKHLIQKNYKDYNVLMETKFGKEISHNCIF